MERAGMWVLVCAWVATGMPAALAQTGRYPERPIRLIVPWPPGGTVDVNARILGPAVSKSIGQQIVVDNRAGASGIIGTGAAAREKPDGYSLILNT
ncbi:MAG: Bug family tripartite tricarboxylate transporter substrate binding protein, partial [Burkholderiales bacterium]